MKIEKKLINETLIRLNEKLNVIYNLSDTDIERTNCFPNSFVDCFYVGEEKDTDRVKCTFSYGEGCGGRWIHDMYFSTEPTCDNSTVKVQGTNFYRKRDLDKDIKRKRMSVWFTEQIISHLGKEEELKEYFFDNPIFREVQNTNWNKVFYENLSPNYIKW